MYNNLNYLWSLSLEELQSICSEFQIISIGLNRGDIIKLLVDKYSFDKVDLKIGKKVTTIKKGDKNISVECKTCGK